MKKRVISMFLAVVMCFCTAMPAWASNQLQSRDAEEAPDIGTATIDAMTNAQRNAFISQCAAQELEGRSADAASGRTIVTPIQTLRLCWYAAAKIAESSYPCASKIIQYSAMGTDYEETDGQISAAIKRSSDYKAWRTTHSASSMSFSSGDLFYALHLVDISVVNQTTAGAQVCVTDTVDFRFETNLGSIFNTVVNDWAWLSQKVGALTPIQVNISFVDPAI